MRVNSTIKSTLDEISSASIGYHNEPHEQRRYIRRLLRFAKKHLSESEQVFLINNALEQLHYKSIITDEETIAIVTNNCIKRYISIFVLASMFSIINYFLFVDDSIISNIIDQITSLTTILEV